MPGRSAAKARRDRESSPGNVNVQIRCLKGAVWIPYTCFYIIIQGNDREGRTKLFEEFLECSGNWMESALVINHRNFLRTTRKGVYKYMSFAAACLNY